MLNLDKVRLDELEKKALSAALSNVKERVYLFGSRTKTNEKGGDIDILIFSDQNPFNLSREIKQKFFLECEEKIDVIVFDDRNLTDEQRAFLSIINLVRLK